MTDDWTEPDTSEERWMQPYEEERRARDLEILQDFYEWLRLANQRAAGPEWIMAVDDEYDDFYAPRARWVSER